jgi:hypothetical protein
MDMYAIIKTAHILSGTVLFGTGIGTAFFFWRAHAPGNEPGRLMAARTTVLADWIFTGRRHPAGYWSLDGREGGLPMERPLAERDLRSLPNRWFVLAAGGGHSANDEANAGEGGGR